MGNCFVSVDFPDEGKTFKPLFIAPRYSTVPPASSSRAMADAFQ
jgi:hypothetical protein